LLGVGYGRESSCREPGLSTARLGRDASAYLELSAKLGVMQIPDVILRVRALFGPIAVVLLAGAAILWSPFEPHRPPVDVIPPPRWADEDWAIFQDKVDWARSQSLDTLPIGDAMAALGQTFVGTAYVPQTLEAAGPEGLVINFRGLDCVTFVENVYALSRFVHLYGAAAVADRPAAEASYASLLTELRYRGGIIDGYPSRLHYFTDWIADNALRGAIRDITPELGGEWDEERIDFMSTHTDAYRQLSDPANVAAVRGAETGLNTIGRAFVPEDGIEAIAQRIRDGDIIAATSTVAGLDVAHTGLALWVDGTLRLMHAPLVGDSVQISEITLAERVQGIGGQDGIIVARPLAR
jgi:hypothetical protein